MAVAAIEVGFKQVAAKLAPQSTWLLNNMQSPSIDRMIAKWLPQLLADKELRAALPNIRLLKSLIKAIELRNKLVHAGGRTPDVEEVESFLQDANDLLHLFDVYAGCDWAVDLLSRRARAEHCAAKANPA
jgi:hypothetical protein